MLVLTKTVPFDLQMAALHEGLLQAPQVDTGHWQSLKDVPHTKTRELQNVTLEIPIPASVDETASLVEPNLPWAEDHFRERVDGEPLNPGEQYKNWPWARGNVDQHRTGPDAGYPTIPAHQWSYLAGFLEADGSISCKTNDGFPTWRVQVGQKDPEILRYFKDTFLVGRLNKRVDRPPPRSTQSSWCISSKHDVVWILQGLVPYLKTSKRDKAETALKDTIHRVKNGNRSNTSKPLLNREEPFSHSYMERIWPTSLGRGIRYRLGDLNDMVDLLVREPYTRQAYLPIWFPEDTGAHHGERVPCSLGYHFMLRNGKLNVTYHMRSVDFLRYLRDDIYMAMRLGQWVLSSLMWQDIPEDQPPHEEKPWPWDGVEMGDLWMTMASLHVFEGDMPKMRREAPGAAT